MNDVKFTKKDEISAETEMTEEDLITEQIAKGGRLLAKTYAKHGKCDEDKMALFREASMLFDDFCKAVDDEVFEIRKPEVGKMGTGRLRVDVRVLDISFEPFRLFKELIEISDGFCVTELANGYLGIMFGFDDLIVVDWDNLED